MIDIDEEARPTIGATPEERMYNRALEGRGKLTEAHVRILESLPNSHEYNIEWARDIASGRIEKPAETNQAAGRDKFVPSFEMITPATAKLRPRPAFLIPGVVKPGETTIWYGQPKSNKSSLLGDAYMHAALGRAWMGRDIKRKMHCIFVAAERSEVTEQRLIAFMEERGVKSRNFPFHICIGDGFDMTDEDHRAALLARIREYEAIHGKTDMIAIDTLTQTFGDGNQNEGVAMAKYGRAAVAFRKEIGPECHMHIVHHEPKAESGERFSKGGPKGAIDLLGIVEGAFQVRELGPEEERYREFHCYKSNTIGAGRILAFSYDIASAGMITDEHDGEEIEVLDVVCKPSEVREFGRDSTPTRKPSKPLTVVQRACLWMHEEAKNMRNAQNYRGEKDGTKPEDVEISLSDLKEKYRRSEHYDSVDEVKKNTIRSNVSKAVASMDRKGVIQVHENRIKVLIDNVNWEEI